MSTLVKTPSEPASSLSPSLAEVRSKHRHPMSGDVQSGPGIGQRGDTSSIPSASQAEVLRRLESLRAGLTTLTREHLRADTEAFEDTMSVLNEEIADLLAVLGDTRP